MNKNLIIAVIVLLLLGAGGYYIMTQNAATSPATNDSMTEESNQEDATTQQTQTTTMEATKETTLMAEKEAVEFEVNGADFKFDPSTMTVKQGDTVRIVFTNTDASMPHDWVVDEFNARTKVLKPGESETIEFVADAAGEFEFYCSVGQHRANGMVGTLTVN